MTWSNPYFTNLEKINLLCRWILVHSIIYYDFNTNIISDHMFDANCKQLVNIISKNKEIFKQSPYYYFMYDFNSSTGMHLSGKLNLKDSKKYNDIAERQIRRNI